MRRIIFQMMVSLDGFFEGLDRDISWHTVDEEFNAYAVELLDSVDLLLFGRVTYELMAGYWPLPETVKNDPLVAARMNNLNKIVFSKTLRSADWQNTRLVRSNVGEELRRLKEAAGKDIAIFGSSNFALTVLRLGLIDEYRIIVSPTVLGKGDSLLQGINGKLNLTLTGTKAFRSGNVLLSYAPNKKTN
jgi:dihydrofolate reductase